MAGVPHAARSDRAGRPCNNRGTGERKGKCYGAVSDSSRTKERTADIHGGKERLYTRQYGKAFGGRNQQSQT